MNLDRRHFISASGAFLLASSSVRATTSKRIVVLGAGLSGLATAYELRKRGFEVTVLEARNRVGGRIKTLRSPFSDDLFTETGGELIGDGYKRFIGYAKKFGIPLSELEESAETGGSVASIQGGIGRNAYMRGKFYRKGDVWDRHPYNLKGDEANVLPPTLFGKYIRLISNKLRKKEISMESLDKISIAAAIRAEGATKKAIRLMDISLNYNSIYTVSAAGVMDDVRKRRNAGVLPLKITGGNDLLPKAFANELERMGTPIRLRNEVLQIENKEGSASVLVKDTVSGEVSRFNADHIVCTIPFSVLRNIKITPELPKTKRSAIDKLPYTQISKVYIQAKYSEWDKRSLGSSVWTDTPIERIFATKGTPGAERALFTIWTEGKGAIKLDKMSTLRRRSFAVDQFVKVLPFMKDSTEKTFALSWDSDPYARGAYSHYRIGQLTSLGPVVGERVGRLHFAGEHTAIDSPGMEGAFESAERVVAEIAG